MGIKSATNIVDLQFGRIAPDFISASSDHVLFDRLQIFADQSHWVSPQLISFLRFHPTVEQLHLCQRFDIFKKSPLPLTGVVLPHLKIYEGPSHIVHLVIPGSSVSDARIWWGSYPDVPSDFNLVLSSLAKSSVPVTVLTCRGYCWNLEILPLLAKYMIDLERLEFVASGASVAADVGRFIIILHEFVLNLYVQVFTRALRPVVEQSKRLKMVKLQYVEEEVPTITDLDSDYKTLLEWDCLRSSLIVVTFASKSINRNSLPCI